MEDPYKILGVNKNASQEEIKRAYKKLALETHPDRNPGDASAETKFKEVNNAYSILSDPQKRAEHDNPFRGFDSFANFFRNRGGGFSMNFGFEEPRRRPPAHGEARGRDIRLAIRVSPFDILLNNTVSLRYERRVYCGECEGHGADLEQCNECNGVGFITNIVEAGKQRIRKDEQCGTCMGRAFIQKNKCSACGGSGLVVATVEEVIQFSPLNNGHLKVAGKGHYGPYKGQPGDLLLELHINFPGEEISEEAKEHLRKAVKLIYKQGD